MFLNQLGKYLRAQWLDPKVKLCLSFVRNYKLSSKVAVAFCMYTSVKFTLCKPNWILLQDSRKLREFTSGSANFWGLWLTAWNDAYLCRQSLPIETWWPRLLGVGAAHRCSSTAALEIHMLPPPPLPDHQHPRVWQPHGISGLPGLSVPGCIQTYAPSCSHSPKESVKGRLLASALPRWGPESRKLPNYPVARMMSKDVPQLNLTPVHYSKSLQCVVAKTARNSLSVQ